MRSCPQCGSWLVREARRQGLLEESLSLLMIYPFRCQLCAHRFRAFAGRLRINPTREYDRIAVRYPVCFESAFPAEVCSRVKGTVVDLSVLVCSILGPVPVPTGTCLRLGIRAAEYRDPVEIDLAVVRAVGKNVTQNRLGLQFLRVAPEQQGRLRGMLIGRLQARLH